jgi:hypothetical protein
MQGDAIPPCIFYFMETFINIVCVSVWGVEETIITTGDIHTKNDKQNNKRTE